MSLWEAEGGELQISSGGLREGLSRKAVCQKAWPKCLLTNVCSMGNEPEKLETVICLGKYDLVAIMETGGMNLMSGIQ